MLSAVKIVGKGIDDTFVLCEEDAGPVTVGDVTFEGRALLIRRVPELQTLALGQVRLEMGVSSMCRCLSPCPYRYLERSSSCPEALRGASNQTFCPWLHT